MRLKPILLHCLAVALMLVAAGSAHAATMLGTVYRGTQPAAGQYLLLSCGKSSVTGRSDDNGRYRLTINGSGKCFVQAAGSNARMEVILFNQSPARVDLALDGVGANAKLRER